MKNHLIEKILAGIIGLCLIVFVGHAAAERVGNNADIQKELDSVIAQAEKKGASFGFKLMDVETGKEIYSHKGETPLIPASTMKLVTSIVALYHLTPSFTFSTKFYSSVPIDENGVIASDLYIVGEGDPLILEQELKDMAAQLYAKGLRRITGNIVVDDDYFEKQKNVAGWKKKKAFSCSEPFLGATSVAFNTIYLQIMPPFKPGQKPEARLSPEYVDYHLINKLTASAKRRTRVMITLRGKTVTVTGVVNAREKAPIAECINIHDTARFAGETIAGYLKQAGIMIGGNVSVGARPPEFNRLVLNWKGKSLEEILYRLNKASNNFIAEQIFKSTGAHALGGPGTWEKGATVADDFISKELRRKDGYKIINGSGLSRGNLLSAGLLVDLLVYVWKNPTYTNPILKSLPVMGVDGTLRRKNKNGVLAERVIAKTGSLDHVSTLSGYITTDEERVLAFALLINNHAHRYINTWMLCDKILLATTKITMGKND